MAAQRGSLSLVKLLLEHGADVNAVDFNQATPLAFVALQVRLWLGRVGLDGGHFSCPLWR